MSVTGWICLFLCVLSTVTTTADGHEVRHGVKKRACSGLMPLNLYLGDFSVLFYKNGFPQSSVYITCPTLAI